MAAPLCRRGPSHRNRAIAAAAVVTRVFTTCTNVPSNAGSGVFNGLEPPAIVKTRHRITSAARKRNLRVPEKLKYALAPRCCFG